MSHFETRFGQKIFVQEHQCQGVIKDMERSHFRKLVGLASGFSVALVLAACSATPQNLAVPTPEEQIKSQAASTFQTQISSSADDVEEYNGSTFTDSPVLELGVNGLGYAQTLGLRFQGVSIPQKSKILDARIVFTAVTDRSETTQISVFGEDVANSAPFVDASGNPTTIGSRAKTSASRTWTMNAWADKSVNPTVDLKSIVQEIVSRSDWNGGNALSLIISGSGVRKAQSFEGNSQLAPKLTVSYEPPPPTGSTSLTLQPIDSTLGSWESLFTNPKYDTKTQDAFRYISEQIQKDKSRYGDASCKSSTGSTSSATNNACKGARSEIGRELMFAHTSLIELYRVLPHKYLTDEINRLMKLAQGNLNSVPRYSVGGSSYRQWRLPGDTPGTELSDKENPLANGYLPEVVYVLAINADEYPEYRTNVTFWTNYLLNDFEGMWKAVQNRGDTKDGQPKAKNGLPNTRFMHAYAQLTRYVVYMDKLAKRGDLPGRSATYYQAVRDQMVQTLRYEFIAESGGGQNGFVWGHFRRSFEAIPDGDPLDFQMSGYTETTAVNVLDMALEGVPQFSTNDFMQRLAVAIGERQLRGDNDPETGRTYKCGSTTIQVQHLLRDIGGSVYSDITNPNDRETRINGKLFKEKLSCNKDWYQNDGFIVSRTYAALSAWQGASNLAQLEQMKAYKVLNGVFNSRKGSLTGVFTTPASLAFARLYLQGGYTLK